MFKRLQFKLQTVYGPPSTLGQSKYEETRGAVGFGGLGFGGFGGAAWGRLFRRPPRSPSLSCFAPARPALESEDRFSCGMVRELSGREWD